MGILKCSKAYNCGHGTSLVHAGHCTGTGDCGNNLYNCPIHGRPVKRPF